MIYRQNKPLILFTIIATLTGALLSSCSSTAKDPLKNSKKLFKEGHVSLYNNGAFKVPNTEITLIPAGPSAYDFAFELAGMHARQSFIQSIKNAGDSVSLVADGTRKSYRLAGDVITGSNKVSGVIKKYSRSTSKLLIYKSDSATKHIIGSSWDAAARSWSGIYKFGGKLTTDMSEMGQMIRDKGGDAGISLIGNSWSGARTVSKKSLDMARGGLSYARVSLVEGYMSLPQKAEERWESVTDAVSIEDFKKGFTEPYAWAADTTNQLSTLLFDTGKNYTSNIGQTFGKAKAAIKNYRQEGTLAVLKSIGYVFKGAIWDGVIAPVGTISAASVGIVSTNLVALPVMVVAREGITTTELAIQVSWNALRFGYDIVAPGVISATAGALSIAGGVAGQGVSAVTAVGGATLGAGEYVLSQATGGLLTVSGHVTGKTVQYIGVPIGVTGIVVTGTAGGLAVGGTYDAAKVVAGGALFVTGEVTAVGTSAFGVVLGGSTLAVGTAASTVAGVGLGVYELTKAIVVPTTYELTSGVVIGYTSMTHIAAHTILGVADAAYLVLSLEGPRWVIYAVKGDLDDGEELIPGTVLNLESMRDAGETFYYLPVSESEMRNVIETLPADIPAIGVTNSDGMDE